MKKMKFSIILALLCMTGFSAKSQNVNEKPIFHYSVLDGLRNGVYTGDLSIAVLKSKGDFGLGTYNYLDGEMIVLNGVVYRIAGDGKVSIAESKLITPFAAVTFFKEDKVYELVGISDFEEMQKEIIKKLPSENKSYAVQIECEFESMKVGSANKVMEDETTGLAELMKTRPTFEKQNVIGTLVGFYTPAYMSSVNLSPFHFHFLSKDRKFGGHFMSGKFNSTVKIKVRIDEKPSVQVVFPENNQAFERSWLQEKKAKSVY